MSQPMTRSEAARIAALTRHSLGDTKKATEPARRGFMARFEDAVDKDRLLPEAERQARAHRALRAHMLRLSAKSAAARRRRAS